MPKTHLVHQEQQGAPLFLQDAQKIAVLEGVGPGALAGEIIQGGRDDLDQVGEGLEYPQIEVEGDLGYGGPQFPVAAVEKQEVQGAAIFQGIDHHPLLGELLQAVDELGLHRHLVEEGVQGVTHQQTGAAGEIAGVMKFFPPEPAGEAVQKPVKQAPGFVGLGRGGGLSGGLWFFGDHRLSLWLDRFT